MVKIDGVFQMDIKSRIGSIVKYAGTGVLSTLADNLVFFLLTRMGCSNLVGVACARVVSVAINFLMLRFAVFKGKTDTKGSFLRYIALVIVSGAIVWFAIEKLTKVLTWEPTIIKMCIELVMFFVNYYVNKTLVFRKSSDGE